MVKKAFSSLCIKGAIRLFEKRHSDGNRQYRYLLQTADAPQLIVVFSGFPGAGAKAGYNYIRTLKDIRCNKLFLLDNFGFQSRGAYYLAENGDFGIEAAFHGLITEIRQRLKSEATIYLGSSKGGYAALYYGIKNEADCIIAGSPQFYLGRYLSLPSHKPILAAIMGDDGAAGAARLDRLLTETVTDPGHAKKPKVYLQYSKNEPAYGEHLRDLVQALRENGFPLSQNIGAYLNHGDLVNFFPNYLLDVLTNQMGVPRKGRTISGAASPPGADREIKNP